MPLPVLFLILLSQKTLLSNYGEYLQAYYGPDCSLKEFPVTLNRSQWFSVKSYYDNSEESTPLYSPSKSYSNCYFYLVYIWFFSLKLDLQLWYQITKITWYTKSNIECWIMCTLTTQSNCSWDYFPWQHNKADYDANLSIPISYGLAMLSKYVMSKSIFRTKYSFFYIFPYKVTIGKEKS